MNNIDISKMDINQIKEIGFDLEQELKLVQRNLQIIYVELEKRNQNIQTIGNQNLEQPK